MKRIYYLFIYILPVMVLLSACLKDETKITFKLPRETQSGENTLGFRVGNDVWVNYGKRCFIDMGCSGPNLTGYFWHHPEQIEIRAYRELRDRGALRKDEDFFLILDSLLPTGTYHRYFSILFSDRRKDRNYVTAPGKQLFTLHITRLDTTERIFSGAFSGTLFYKKRDTLDAPVDLTDSLVIEDGRFDIRLR